MSDYIPSEVYGLILLRLPADSLLRFRSVCKAWRHLIDDPTFVKSHHLFSSNNHNTLLIKNEIGDPLYLINLDSIDFTKCDHQLIDAIPLKRLIGKSKRKTCNGLILISSRTITHIWAIWNPLTRSCHQLPPPPDAADISSKNGKLSKVPATGLGYDYVADDYKVVRIDPFICEGVIVNRTLVYSRFLGCWRRIKDCPYDFCSFADPNGVFLKDAIHWLSRDMIYVLDLGTEDYRQLALPPPLETIGRDYWYRQHFGVQLDAIGGCLSFTLTDYSKKNNISGWVMKDYGADWVKLFTLDLGHCGVYGEMPKRLVAFLESKRQVLFQQDGFFLWYDVENGDVKRVTIHGLSIFSSQICPGSIYRLDDSDSVVSRNVGSNKRKRNKTNKGVSTRLKFCLKDCDTMCYSR